MSESENYRNIIDLNAVTTTTLSRLTGKSRQTIHAWFCRHNLPRNPDGTYSLRHFLKWFEEFTIRKLRRQRARPGVDGLRQAKAEKIELETKLLRKELFKPSCLLADLPGKLELNAEQIEALEKYLGERP